jgi:site-specific DNA recombinase
MEYDKLNSRIKRMYDDKLDGLISEEHYKEKLVEYQSRINELQAKLNDLHEANNNYYLNATRILELASKASELFESSEVDEKHLLVSLVLSNLRLEGDKLLYDWVRPFDVIVEHASCTKWRAL